MKSTITGFSRLPVLMLACASSCDTSAAEFKVFRDWYAACDNLRNCSAYGLQAKEPASAYVRVDRSGAPSASARITIAATVNEKTTVTLAFDDEGLRGLPSGPVTLERNDRDYGRLVIDDPAAVETLLASMRKAQTLTINSTDPPGGDPETSEISMSGAVAALLWIDEQQQRLGTVTAHIRRADKPASSIAPQPKAPVVHATKPLPANGAPKSLPPKEARALAAKAKALCGEEEEHTRLDDTVRLGRDNSLYIFSCPDIGGAYNLSSVFLIVPDTNPQATRAVNFVYPIRIDSRDAASEVTATNASFDRSTMTLSTFSKGRGRGDCGRAEDWVWDGQTFQLTLLRVMRPCKGVTDDDWPVIYRAEVRM